MILKDYINLFEEYVINTAGYEKSGQFYYEFEDKMHRTMTIMTPMEGVLKINIHTTKTGVDYNSFSINRPMVEDIVEVMEKVMGGEDARHETFKISSTGRGVMIQKHLHHGEYIYYMTILDNDAATIALKEDEMYLIYDLIVEFGKTGSITKKDI